MNASAVSIRNAALCTMFFFSGLCCLVYETIWLRLAFAEFGAITPVVSVVISVFMAGLGLGSWLGGKYISSFRKKTHLTSIIVYGLVEISIGIGGLAVPWLLKHTSTLLFASGETDSWSYLLSSSLWICMSVLPWTFLMGCTYPVVLEFLHEYKDDDRRQFGRLYAANTAGAVIGTLLTVFVLVEAFGFQETLLLTASINFFIGMLAILWGLWRARNLSGQIETGKYDHESVAPISVKDVKNILRPFDLLILFTTGFCLMAMEVGWIRAFAPFLGSMVYSFALLLAIYLACNWFGTLLYRINITYNKIKSKNTLIVATSVCSALPLLTANYDLCHFLSNYLGRSLSMALLLIIPVGAFSVLLGYLTPLLIDDISQSSATEAGRTYAVNTLGCILGPLISGYVLLPIFGARSALMILTLPFIGLTIINQTLVKPGEKMSVKILATAILIVCTIFLTSFHGSTWEEGGYFKTVKGTIRKIYRDYTATTITGLIKGTKLLIVNGQGMTEISSLVKMMVHLPVGLLLAPPKSVLIICFGMGTTYRSALSWNAQVTAVELLPSVMAGFGDFFDDALQVLNNPKGRTIIDDGRRFLNRCAEKFDVITVDPPPPIYTPASSLLYSAEFFQLIKKHLQPDGILQEWYYPAADKSVAGAIARSISEAFPYVRVFRSGGLLDSKINGYYFIASQKPILVPTSEQLLARMPERVKCDLQEIWTDDDSAKKMKYTIGRILSSEIPINWLLVSNKACIITDDHPFNEYFLLRRLTGWRGYFGNDLSLADQK